MGGLGVHINEVINRLDTEKYNVTAICQGADDGMIKGVKVFGITPYNYRYGNVQDAFSETYLNQSKFVTLATKLLMQKEIPVPHIIHCCDWSTAPAAWSIAEITGAKIVFAVHLSINNYIKEKDVNKMQQLGWNVAKSIEFEACRRAFTVLQVSDNYSNLYPFSIYKHKTTIVPNGVDTTLFENTDPFLFPGTGKIKILYIGRIEYMKNVDSLMEINVPEGCDLIFAGGKQGSSEYLINKLNEICKRNNRIHYIGPIYDNDKYAAICSADLVIMPSKHEPFGMVALEACAAAQMGKTIFASSFKGGMGEFLTTDCAINCGVTKESIEDAINKFSTMTEAKKNKMRKAAIKVAKRYSWQNTADIISGVYEQLTNQK